MAKQSDDLDELVAQTFSADFRRSLQSLLDRTATAAAQKAANQVASGMVQSFALVLQKFELTCSVEEINGAQSIVIAGRGVREVTRVTRWDARGRIVEFEKTVEPRSP